MRRQFAATAIDVLGLAGRLDEIRVGRPPFSLTFENALAPARFRGASEREIWKNPACAKMPRRRHLPPFERRSRDVHRFSLAQVYWQKQDAAVLSSRKSESCAARGVRQFLDPPASSRGPESGLASNRSFVETRRPTALFLVKAPVEGSASKPIEVPDLYFAAQDQ